MYPDKPFVKELRTILTHIPTSLQPLAQCMFIAGVHAAIVAPGAGFSDAELLASFLTLHTVGVPNADH